MILPKKFALHWSPPHARTRSIYSSLQSTEKISGEEIC
jgi:hypothetical protein